MIVRKICNARCTTAAILTFALLVTIRTHFVSETLSMILRMPCSPQYDGLTPATQIVYPQTESHLTDKQEFSPHLSLQNTRASSGLNTLVDSSRNATKPILEETRSSLNTSSQPSSKSSDDKRQDHAKPPVSPKHSCSSMNIITKVYDEVELNASCHYVMYPPGQSPGAARTNYLMANKVGRLGNQMFTLASSFGIAHAQNKTLCLSQDTLLLDIFKLKTFTKINWHKSETWTNVTEHAWGEFDPCLLQLPHNHSIVGDYLQSYKYFDHIRDKITDLFNFHDDISAKAVKMLNSVWSPKTYPRNQTAVVGVHMRRGDMLEEWNHAIGHTAAPRSYYRRAFQWIVDALPTKDVVFVVVSEDIPWCEKYLSSDSVKIAPEAPAEVHLALLASCDHVIMSTGTFGWWGAWLSRGKVVYYKNYPIKDSVLAKGFNSKDFFLPKWVGLE